MNRFLVLGATGAQGGAVARRLVRDGHDVRGMSRSGAAVAGVQMVAGDLGKADDVRRAFADVTHVSVTLPLVYDRETVAGHVGNIVNAARSAGVRRLVFNTSSRIPAAATSIAAFETRRDATRAFLGSGIPAVVLRPPVYLENLIAPWSLGPLLSMGRLINPEPAELRVAWLSHDDLAALTVAALTREDLVGVYDVGGRDVVTGDELAAAFGRAMSRQVTYVPQPIDDFEAGLAMAFDAETAAGVADTYRWAAGAGGAGIYEGDPGAIERTFGIALTPLDRWVARALAEAEIRRLHQVIEGWRRGDASELSSFADALAPEFTIGVPDGPLLGRSEVVTGFKDMYGRAPAMTIEIRNVELAESRDDLIVASYEEWQRDGTSENGRRSTAVFTDGLRWRHLQETWIVPERD